MQLAGKDVTVWNGEIHAHCNTCIQVGRCTVQAVVNESCDIVKCALDCGFNFHACKTSEHRLLCPNERTACINASNGCPVQLVRRQQGHHLETCPASVVVCNMEWNRWPVSCREKRVRVPFHVPNPQSADGQLDTALALRDQRVLNESMKLPWKTRLIHRTSFSHFPAVPLHMPGETAPKHPSPVHEESQPADVLQSHVSAVALPPPPSSPLLSAPLGLELSRQSITRYQNKPRNMYTFLCAQLFRRDEYPWHYKNVHGDIHSGLDGWLEQRCPLAHYGCVFSLRRLYPTARGARVVYSELLESFGVQPNAVCYEASMSPGLCQLPFEVLRHICCFLDSFSLCNMALTCRYLRDVCASLLTERGMVVQSWKKTTAGSEVRWSLGCKRWCFSTAFTQVNNWGFEAKGHMSNHLRSCVCYERSQYVWPYFHLLGAEPSESLCAKLMSHGDGRQQVDS